MGEICREIEKQYRDFLFQKAATSGDTKTMSTMNWEDLIETLIQGGITGDSPKFLLSISDELHKMFVGEFNREPSKANAEDLHWLKQHIYNWAYYQQFQVGFNEEVFEGVVLPSLQRQYQSSFRKNATIAKEAAREAYFDKYGDEAGRGYTNAIQQFRRTMGRKPTASAADMARLSELFVSIMQSRGWTI